jgi:hypothetical protein
MRATFTIAEHARREHPHFFGQPPYKYKPGSALRTQLARSASGPKTSGLIFIAMLIGGRRSTRGGRVSARRNIEALSSGMIRQRRDDGSKADIPSPR